jgi:DNA-binding CsgD family transcriptional regulator
MIGIDFPVRPARASVNMYLTSSETKSLLAVLQALNGDEELEVRRAGAGRRLLDLLQADYFASYHWSEEHRRFENRVSVNMSDANLHRYEEYFQFRDPITRPMQRMRRAVSVNQIMDHRDFLRTEFYNDFLAQDGLYYGVNLHVFDGDSPVADWRIWRSHGRENFGQRSLEILNLLAPHLRNATRIARLLDERRGTTRDFTVAAVRAGTGLSEREAQIAYHAALGKADREIAAVLFVSVATVRTHLRHIYRKLGVSNRSSFCRRLSDTLGNPGGNS